MRVRVVCEGVPVAKGRPRMTRQGGAYTPAHTRRYEADLRYMCRVAMAGAPPLEGALEAHVLVVLPIPKSFSRKRRELALAGEIRPTTRPDADNFLKAVLDAGNTVLWHDDAQLVGMSVNKFYGDRPRLEIGVGPLCE